MFEKKDAFKGLNGGKEIRKLVRAIILEELKGKSQRRNTVMGNKGGIFILKHSQVTEQ